MRPASIEGGLREMRAGSARPLRAMSSMRAGSARPLRAMSSMRAGSARALPAREVRAGSDPPALPSAPYPGLAAGFLEQLDLGDRHAALDGLHHVVDGQRRDGGGGERLHLDAGLVDG